MPVDDETLLKTGPGDISLGFSRNINRFSTKTPKPDHSSYSCRLTLTSLLTPCASISTP